jgi:uncharacterized protein YabN with tetrapyrrole methylase and pyrophosphatase domain
MAAGSLWSNKHVTMQKKTTLEDLVELMATLRSEQGCPWDRKQTKDTIKPYIIEETYEMLSKPLMNVTLKKFVKN